MNHQKRKSIGKCERQYEAKLISPNVIEVSQYLSCRPPCHPPCHPPCPPHCHPCPPCPLCPPTLPPTGACIPLALGHKPKQSLETKLQHLLENNQVPSVLAAHFFQLTRRFLAGSTAANPIEIEAFNVFKKLSPELRNILSCSLQTFDALPSSDRWRIFSPEISSDEPIAEDALAFLVVEELIQRASLMTYNNNQCDYKERPGMIRPFPGIDQGELVVTPQICRVNGIRTISTGISLAEYQPEELQRECTLEVTGDTVQQNCQVLTPPCPGHSKDGVCLRVPEVKAGDTVTLEGYNFFDVDAKVFIVGKSPSQVERTVDAHVCGDMETPLTEIVNDAEQVIHDCRVHDIITFQVPSDLPDGIYSIQVAVQNKTGIGNPGMYVSVEQYIQVLPSPSVNYQIATESLYCPDETDPEWAGSDEVGIRILSIPIGLDFTPGPMTENNFRFNDMDSGNTRGMNRVIFQQGNTSGAAIAIAGYEIDDDDFYEAQIQSFTDSFVEVVKGTWGKIADKIGSLAGTVLGALGVSSAWAGAIGVAISLVIVAIIALWAPADLLIEDVITLSTLDLATLTSVNYPVPPITEYTSNGGIDVRIEPISKDVQYREKRRYHSSDEDSEYQIIFRYNRF